MHLYFLNLLVSCSVAATIYGLVAENPQLKTLTAVLDYPAYKDVKTVLNNPVGELTLFAPNDDAWTAAGIDYTNPSLYSLVNSILFYHVPVEAYFSGSLAPLQFPDTAAVDKTYVNLGGIGQVLALSKASSGVFVNWGTPGNAANTAQVVQADLYASNGVAHVINKVIFPFPSTPSKVAEANGLTTLVSALEKTGLTSTIDSMANLTIFAPTNEAFTAAGWDSLTKEQLNTVLTYHVVPQAAYSTYLVPLNNTNLSTLDKGQMVQVSLPNSGGVVLKDATGGQSQVTLADILTWSGVVHVIDRVLIPGNL